MDNYEKAIELIKSLNFPSREELESGERTLVFGRSWGVWGEVRDMGKWLPQDTYQHSLRTAIKGVKLVRYLGIGKAEVSPRGNAEQAEFITGIGHDFGKAFPDVKEVVKKSEDIAKNGGEFTKKDREKMKEHSFAPEFDLFISAMKIRVHSYQEDPYPLISLGPEIKWLNNLKHKIPSRVREKFSFGHNLLYYRPFFYDCWDFGERSPEVEYLSKLFAFVDSHDASLTRKLGNNGNQRYLTAEESMNSLLNIYGNLDVSYNGNKLPKVKQTGRDLIVRLYEDGIFGAP